MSTAPVVPQRPVRTQDAAPSAPPSDLSGPRVPPRPRRNPDGSRSPNREFAARSPLNDPPFKAPGNAGGSANGQLKPSHAVRQRPSISSLPLIGQEGEEYTSLDQVPQVSQDVSGPATPNDTINVAGDLPLHAPRASVPSAASQSKVASVVRTDSQTAIEAGLGRVQTESDDGTDLGLRKTVSRSREFRPASSGLSREITRSSSRPGSIHEDHDERGIPHFGSYVPMYPNAGDVQAPSPSPYASQGPPSGVGFFNDGSSRPATMEGRRKSATGFHGPPGSYGLHGHGVGPHDQFEKAWYQKHPEELVKEEQGAYGPSAALSRGEWVLSSEELNRLVRENNERGFGTSETAIGVPSEAIGYKASEEYSSRVNSPSLQPVKSRRESQIYAASPLRNASVPGGGADIEDDKIHLDSPTHRTDKYTGGGYDPPTVDLGPEGGNTSDRGGWIDERGTGTPILASDEIQKRPGYEYLQPAVSPEAFKHGDSDYFSEYDSDTLPAWQRRKATNSGRSSRRPSRPSSARFHHHDMEMTGTPLNEIEEYEPLFKDDEEQKKPATAADKLKRPELERRFPSQDIWEDTPNSLQLQTTVGGPQEPEETLSTGRAAAAAAFETPEQEQARRGEITEAERPSFLRDPSRTFAKPKFNAGVQEEVQTRPGLRHRFPSQDIWEDTPDSLRLETTVDSDGTTLKSPTGQASNSLAQGFAAADGALAAAEATPVVPARPSRTRAAEQPSIPPRPAHRLKEMLPGERKAPSIPDRPKPLIPSRLSQSSGDEPSNEQTLSKTLSGGSTGSVEGTSPTLGKPRLPVPNRPAQSSKFASIKAGFMNDLNNRLQLGPQAPKPVKTEEPAAAADEEKAPLSDARKSRARGPVRRKPAETAEPATSAAASSTAAWGLSAPRTLWYTTDNEASDLSVLATVAPAKTAPQDLSEAPTASPLATNTAGEALQPPEEAPRTAGGELAHGADTAMDERAEKDEAVDKERLASHELSRIGNEGDVPEPAPEQVHETAPAPAPAAQQHESEPEPAAQAAAPVDEAVQTGETKLSAGLAEEEGRAEQVTVFVDGGKEAGETIVAEDKADA